MPQRQVEANPAVQPDVLPPGAAVLLYDEATLWRVHHALKLVK